MEKFFTVLFLLVFSLTAYGQQRTCGSMENLAEQLEQNPEMARAMEAQERRTREFRPEQRSNTVITIPVVFHIIHDGDVVGTDENISDALIQAQLDQMNADFALLNSDANMIPAMFQPLAANTMIQFCLAERTPDCQPTTGIERLDMGQASWTKAQVNTTLKPATIWDRDQYLNIWTVRFGAPDDGLLGFAQFPGGPANTDGVVNAYYTTGSLANPNPDPAGGGVYNKGRTMTHEVGHWLNLLHIWGDANCGDDLVADTPIHETDNGGCPSHPKTNMCSGTITEMFMNYMDYVNDDCMHMFSQGQSDRMCAVLESGGLRASLAVSEGCIPLGLCYCSAAADDLAANEKIGNVTFAGINQSSTSNAGYENYRLVEGMVEEGMTYAFSATITNAFPTDQILVWIDYNQNGDYTDAGELVFTSSIGTGPHTTNITIPAGATSGQTRMRVRLHDTSLGPNATPCGNSDYGQVEDYSINVMAIVPVEYLSFEADLIEPQDVLLNWATATETNNKGFTVEMASKTAEGFAPLGFVPADPSQDYKFTVKGLANGQYYFRLRQEDFDGQFEYSPIRTLKIENDQPVLQVYPNPARDVLTLQFAAALNEAYTVAIYEQTGRLVKTQQFADGTQQAKLSITDLPPGVYVLQVQSDQYTEYQRFVVE